ncbi:MAG: hypothetical protein A2383_02300 [Candidatus Pacebacteria bacterium RIFOXYB1_FULL_39_46]|nr:MAG: hypothetical protein A2383_02300 [Candidatus Pacebacteria bacterium RIFOXYB1_FULL_39_46]OGJ39103.1 MAG: hypothetical protein A2182_02150 [Candidatus Pacebacteria bacterium RIFOXYA1_FULL_38_18]OGJ40197.1 MAG: hypothetical protein A2582_03855 [Candidatus Pacebacteria bacterium RIFOXYD1_FULL_39_27]OGJ41080.1 MAG: hypothetical protein A2411_01200 [Candidatus Pacebacteria bacterium RIFOXYC1_FULL_39_21]
MVKKLKEYFEKVFGKIFGKIGSKTDDPDKKEEPVRGDPPEGENPEVDDDPVGGLVHNGFFKWSNAKDLEPSEEMEDLIRLGAFNHPH